MRHYHGTPIGGTRDEVARFVKGRHFLVPFGRQEDLPVVADRACGMCFDNGAFTAWKQGTPVTDWRDYYAWCVEWCRHPRFDFAIIPDVIDGSEHDNDMLFAEWFKRCKLDYGWVEGAPVWHLHESLDRLERLANKCRIICLGSSGEFATIGTPEWHSRMAEAMSVVCDEQGRPRCKLHGLRMLAPEIVERYPFASADSTNVAQNKNTLPRFGMYKPPTQSQRAICIAERIEHATSPAVWVPGEKETQLVFSLDWRISDG